MSDVLDARLCLPSRPLRNAGQLRLPDGTCDAHFHVFAPHAPLVSPRSYTPQMETLEGWLALADSFGIARGVLVQPSVYGTDNRVLLTALANHAERLRGVVVIPADTPVSEISRLDRLGVRGVRINLRNKGGIGLDALTDLVPRIRDFGWHVQFQVGPEAIATVTELTRLHDIVGVIDHLAFMALDASATPLDDLRRALDTDRVYVKISAPYRLESPDRDENYVRIVSMLTVCYPNRLLWGSDWPHTELFDQVPEDDDLVALSLAAIPAEHRDRVFVTNPKNLYFSH